jgi:hypothetical protein
MQPIFLNAKIGLPLLLPQFDTPWLCSGMDLKEVVTIFRDSWLQIAGCISFRQLTILGLCLRWHYAATRHSLCLRYSFHVSAIIAKSKIVSKTIATECVRTNRYT